MSAFDAENYFDRRRNAEMELVPHDSLTGLTKYDEVAAAAERKKAALTEMAQNRAIDENSLVGRLGLNPTGIIGTQVNGAMSLVSGASRLAGHLVSLVPNAMAAADLSQMDEEDYAAHQRYVQGKATQEDVARLNSKPIPASPRDTPEAKARAQLLVEGNPNALTKLQLFQRADNATLAGRDINERMDLNSLVHQGRRRELNSDLATGFEGRWNQVKEGAQQVAQGNTLSGAGNVTAGLAKLLYGAVTAGAKNPIAVTEYVLENAPQVMIGAAGKAGAALLGASNVGYAADVYQEGIVNYQKKNGGAYPPEDERQKMAMLAASLALAEHVGEVGQLKAMLPGKTANAAVADPARAGFLASLKNTGKAVAGGVASETPTEGYQTWAEGQITGKPATPLEVYQGATIGGMAGGGLSGAGRAVAEATRSTPEDVAFRKKQLEDQAAVVDAIQTNNITTFLDPTSPSYSPEKAVQVLYGNSQLPETTPENKQANLTKAQEIVTGLDEQYSDAKGDYTFLVAPQEKKQERLDALKAKRAATDPTKTSTIEALDSMIALRESQMTPMSNRDLKVKAAEVSELGRKAKLARQVQDNLSELVQPTPSTEDLQKRVTAANAVVDHNDSKAVEASQKAADTLINLSMRDPSVISHEVATQLADNTQNGLSEPQREFLRKFSAARIAENSLTTLEKVNQEVVTGSKDGKNLGIRDYRSVIGKAVAAGDRKTADRYIELLSSFVADHSNKAAQVTAAIAQARKNNTSTPVQVISTGNGGWKINTGKVLSTRELKENGGAAVHLGSSKLVNAIKAEASALNLALKEQEAAIALKFGGSSPVVATSPAYAPSATASPTPSATAESVAPQQVKEVKEVVQADATNAVGKATAAAQTAGVVEASNQSQEKDLKVAVDSGVQSAAIPPQENNVSGQNAEVESRPEQTQETTSEVDTKKVYASKKEAIAERKSLGNTHKIQKTKGGYRIRAKTDKEIAREEKNAAKFRSSPSINTETDSLLTAIAKAGGLAFKEQADTIKDTNPRIGAQYLFRKAGKSIDMMAEAMAEFGYIPPDEVAADGGVSWLQGAISEEHNGTNVFQSLNSETWMQKRMEEARGDSPDYEAASITDQDLETAGYFEHTDDELSVVDAVMSEAIQEGITEEEFNSIFAEEAANQEQEQSNDNTETLAGQETQDGIEATDPVSEGAISGTVTGKPEEGTKDTEGSDLESETKQTSEEVTPPRESGVLGLFALRSPTVTAFKDRLNLIADFFTQRGGSKEDASLRPLVAVKDFLSGWVNGTVDVQEFLKDSLTDGLFADRQKAVLDLFKEAASSWAELYQKNVVRGNANTKRDNPKYYFNDMMQYLIQNTTDSKGNPTVFLEENVMTAMSVAAFTWIAENGGKSRFNTDEDINRILNRRKEEVVGPKQRNVLGLVGTRENVIRNALGQKAIAALGLKAKKNAPADLMPKLESAIGAHIQKALMEQGILERTSVSAEQMSSIGAKTKEGYESAVHQFLRIARNEKHEVNGNAKAIFEASKNTQGVINKLFSVESGLKEPSLKPIPFTQKTTKNTMMGIPSVLRNIMKKANSEANYVRQDMWNLLENISPETALAMAGVVEVSPQTVHAINRQSQEATNDGLQREYERFTDYVRGTLRVLDESLSMPLFFDHSVWKQQRVGINTNVINPQASKMHRFLVYRKTWESTVSFDNEADMRSFKLRVMEGLGTKTDKETNEHSLNNYAALVGKEPIQAAVKVLVKTLKGESLTAEDQKILVAGVAEGGSKYHSLDALMALAHEAFALENKESSFKTTIVAEVDGVTNGPMLTHILLGAAHSIPGMYALLNKGGFFQEDSPFSQYNHWRAAKGNSDLYESTTWSAVQKLQHYWRNDADLKKTVEGIYAFTGNLLTEDETKVSKAGRNIIKTPLTAMVFGSNMDKAIEDMANNFVSAIYEQIEKRGQKDPSILIAQLNALLSEQNHLDTSMTGAALMEYELTLSQEAQLKAVFIKTVGEAVKTTMEVEFAPFMEARKSINRTAKLTFDLYNAVYTGVYDQYVNELIAKEQAEPGTGIDFKMERGVAVPIQDLNAEQKAVLLDRLQAIHPVMHTAFSKESNDLSSGLLMAKTGRELSSKGPYKGSVQFATPFEDTGSFSVNTTGYEQTMTDPGVRMTSMPVHALDSNISHHAFEKSEALNVHDAHIMGMLAAATGARNLNEATWNAVMNYSPMEEASNALIRVVMGLDTLLKQEQGKLPPEVFANLKTVLQTLAKKEETGYETVLAEATEHSVYASYNANKIKFGTLAILKSLDQYAFEGGNALITPEQRAEAAKREAALISDTEPKVLAAIDRIMAQLMIAPKETKATVEIAPLELDPDLAELDVLKVSPLQARQLLEQLVSGSEDKTIKANAKAVLNDMGTKGRSLKDAVFETLNSTDAAAMVALVNDLLKNTNLNQWGKLGTPTIASDPALVQIFEETPQISAKEMVIKLRALLKAGEGNSQNYIRYGLLGAIEKLLPSDLKIRYVTPTTTMEQVLDKGVDGSRGWYVVKSNGQQEIYVLSPDFATSGLTVETLIHEMLHGVLAQIISKALVDKTGEAFATVQELQRVLDKAKEFAKEKGITKFSEALSNVHELVSWGMSNNEFQKEILEQVQIPESEKKTVLVQGWQKFVNSITILLFGSQEKATQKAQSGMSVLLHNVAGLFNQIAEANKETDNKIAQNLSQVGNAAGNYTYSTQDIYAALNTGAVTPGFDTHLRGVLDSIVEKLHGPFGAFKAQIMENTAQNPVDVFTQALVTGVAPFASKAIASAFKVSNQEAFVLDQTEATIRAAMDENLGGTSSVYSELARVFMEARKRLSPESFHKGDWANASIDEKATAKEKYDFIFNRMDTKTIEGRSDYLAQFAAMGLTVEEFSNLLKIKSTSTVSVLVDKTFLGALRRTLEKALEWFNGKMTHTYVGQPIDSKLESLVSQLVMIENKRQAVLKSDGRNFLSPVEDGMERVSQATRTKLGEIGRSDFFKKSKKSVVRAAGVVISMGSDDRAKLMIEGFNKLREEHFKGIPNVINGTLNYMRGPEPDMQVLLQAGKHLEGKRKAVISQVSQDTLSSFENNGEDLEDSTKAALTAVLLRSGAHILMDKFNMKGMEALVRSTSVRRTAIVDLENQLNQFPAAARNNFLYQSKVLGYYLATGKVRGPFMLRSASNIAKLYGTTMYGKLSPAETATATEIIDSLVSLYAIHYNSAAALKATADLLAKESARTDGGHGVEMVLKTHRFLEKDARERLFRGSEVLMAKGYTPEIYNQHTDVRVASIEEGATLRDLGYVSGAEVQMDPMDPNGEVKHLYVLRDGGLLPWLSGIFSFTGMRSKGTKHHGDKAAGLQKRITAAKQAAIKDMAQSNPGFDPSKVQENYMAPVLNDQGAAVNYVYLMQNKTKDILLERDSRFNEVLGALAGNIFDKETTAEHNAKAVAAAKAVFDSDYAKNPGAFIRVSADSPDVELREIYKLLPQVTRDEIRDTWGQHAMWIRTDMLDINFGYRKLSLSNIFDKEEEDRNAMEKMFSYFVEHALETYGNVLAKQRPQDAALYANYGKRAGVVVRRGERVWQALVQEAKDIFVVKTGTVLLGNIASNLTLLKLHGVPTKDILRHHQVAYKGAEDYQRDSKKLLQLRLQLNSGYSSQSRQELVAEIARVKDALGRNPVKHLIEAGLMPSIVEDVSTEDDPYAYKAEFARKMEKYTKRLNNKVVEVGRTVYMAHDTQMYKTLSHITQLSDFVARYTLYEHLTTRKNKPMTPAEAIQEATDSFVNYDLPMHRQLQYTDDMGITMFTKYFLSIQRILMKRTREAPGRVATLLLLQNYFDWFPTVLESSAISHIGNNPLNLGALAFPTSLDDLATVNLTLSLFR